MRERLFFENAYRTVTTCTLLRYTRISRRGVIVLLVYGRGRLAPTRIYDQTYVRRAIGIVCLSTFVTNATKRHGDLIDARAHVTYSIRRITAKGFYIRIPIQSKLSFWRVGRTESLSKS